MKPVPILFLIASCLAACSPSGGDASAPSVAGEPSTRPEATEPHAPSAQATCEQEIGPEAASILVGQCIQMSPATHPPCNAENSCDMIRDEIRRGCGFGDTTNNPDFCSDYQ
mgnify:CR=1 FL=1